METLICKKCGKILPNNTILCDCDIIYICTKCGKKTPNIINTSYHEFLCYDCYKINKIEPTFYYSL